VILPKNFFAEPLGNIPYATEPLREELPMLPKWCQIRTIAHPRMFGQSRGENVPDSVMRENAKWAKIVGEDIYIFTHHYCRGLNWINRYKKSLGFTYNNVENDRDYALKKALSEFHFMRGRLRAKHKLYYPMLMNEAYVYKEQKDFVSAQRNYIEIIKLKPNYAPAYDEYAALLNLMGKNEDAIKVLQLKAKRVKN
jgi:tetratricopeptide (TPR) repeat protein